MDVYEKIKELVEMMQDFDLTEIEIKDGEKEIKLRKGNPHGAREIVSLPQANPIAFAGAAQPLQANPTADSAATGDAAAVPEKDPNVIEFKSPMVGTFYRAPSPESPPYVTEGDKVNKDTVLCIIEAMKVMNEIKTEMTGEIMEILVENGEAVEFGQPLFLVRRAA